MAKIAFVFFWLGLILVGVNSASITKKDKISLSKIDKRAFGSPKNTTGDILKLWKASKTKPNPEELGEYYEGDILFPTGTIKTTYRWTNNTVPYVLDAKFASGALTNINAAIKNIQTNTCIKFVLRTNQTDYVSITSNNTGCWSSIGKIGGKQQLNLQYPGCTLVKGTVEHELYHVVGFFHEHSRTDRDTYIAVNNTNVVKGTETNFKKVAATKTATFGVAYDYGSVSHYSPYAFSSNGLPTIITKPAGIAIGQRTGLSAKDFEKINAMYDCVKTSTGWTG